MTTDGIQPSSLHILASGLDSNEIIIALGEIESSLDQVHISGHTALTWACILGHVDVVKYLLSKGCSIYHTTMEGRTAFHYSLLLAHDEIVRTLLEHLIRQFFQYQLNPSLYSLSSSAISNFRWTSYADKVESCLEVIDVHGYTAFDLLYINQADLVKGQGKENIDETLHSLGIRPLSRVDGKDLSKGGGKDLAAVRIIEALWSDVKDVVQAWRDLVHREDQLMQPIMCWLNCGFSGQMMEIFDHLRESCPVRLMTCYVCSDLVVSKDMTKHNERWCKHRKVPCPNALQGCGALIDQSGVDAHLRLHCICRLTGCPLLCELYLPLHKLEEHERYHCMRRMIRCSSCGDNLIAVNMALHVKEECPHRMIRCSVGCGGSFIAADIRHHETQVCLKVYKHMLVRV
jgi:hypothetical protein